MRGDNKFPFWPNTSPQDAGLIVKRQIALLIADLPINQIFSGRTDQIPVVQRPYPRQAQALKPGSNDNLEVGQYGSNLYNRFMQPYTTPPEVKK